MKIEKIKLYLPLFLMVFCGFAFQVLCLRFFHLFFHQAVHINILLPVYSGLAAGIFYSHRVGHSRIFGLAFGLISLFAYGLSCLWWIHLSTSLGFLFFFFFNLGIALSREATKLPALHFYLVDILGASLGALAGFFLPHSLGAESSYILFLAIGAIGVSHLFFRLLSIPLFLFSFYLALHPFHDLTQHGANYLQHNMEDYQLLNAQKYLKDTGAKRVFSRWSSVGKIEAIEAQLQTQELVFYSNNRIWFSFPKLNSVIKAAPPSGIKALVIGSGGGKEVRFLLSLGAEVTALELSEVTFNAMKNEFYLESGGFTSQVRYLNREGRNFLETHSDLFDLIFITNMGANGGAIKAGDDQSTRLLFTKEAFQTYYNHLQPGGLLVSTNNYAETLEIPSALLRELETAKQILKENNENPMKNIWVFGLARNIHEQPWRKNKGLVFLRKGEAKNDEAELVEKIRKLIAHEYYPIATPNQGATVNKKTHHPVEDAARKILEQSNSDEVQHSIQQNISPTNDNAPYYNVSSEVISPVQTSFAVAISLAILLAIHFLSLNSSSFFLASCSALLGLSGALIEISLINAVSIFFPSVTLSFTSIVILFSVASSSAAIWAIYRKKNRIWNYLFLSALLVATFQLFLANKFALLRGYSSSIHIFILAVGVFALAFFNSTPFARILSSVQTINPKFVLVVLGCNFAAWGAGSEFARIANFNFGYQATLALAVGILVVMGYFVRKF
jgi:hypothetical protein